MVGHQAVKSYAHSNYVVVEPVGELDLYSTPDFRRQVEAALSAATTPHLLCCDLTRVDFIDSSALGELVRAHRACLAAGLTFCVVGAGTTTRQILHLTQLDTLIPGFGTLAEALASLDGRT